MLSWVWALMKVLLVDTSACLGCALVRSSLSSFTVVLMLPNAMTAFLPFTSITSPTEVWPFILTLQPGVMAARRSASFRACCSAKAWADSPFSFPLPAFFSFFRFCFSFSFSILRAIFSSSSLLASASIDSRKSVNSWRAWRVFSFSAWASLMERMVFSMRALASCISCSTSSFALRRISFRDFCKSSISV